MKTTMADHLIAETARRIAKSFAQSQGWGWDESNANAMLGEHEDASSVWYVTTNPDEWGESVHVVVHAETAEVLASSYRPPLRDPISKEQALAIARQHAEKVGFPWSERVDVFEDEFDCDDRRCNSWSICTNMDRMGGNVMISIDAETGEVLEADFINR